MIENQFFVVGFRGVLQLKYVAARLGGELKAEMHLGVLIDYLVHYVHAVEGFHAALHLPGLGGFGFETLDETLRLADFSLLVFIGPALNFVAE